MIHCPAITQDSGNNDLVSSPTENFCADDYILGTRSGTKCPIAFRIFNDVTSYRAGKRLFLLMHACKGVSMHGRAWLHVI